MAWSINSDNGMGGDPKAWTKCRGLWSSAGIQQFPWKHCRSMADVEELINVAITYNSPAIGLNIEDVVSDKLSLQEVAGYVLDFWVNPHGGAVHMPTLCWVQNSQNWQYMDFVVAALEIFIDEVPACARTQDCIDHAFAEGLKNVTLMLKTKPPNAPSTYGTFFSICHSLYTADDIQPDAPSWNAWIAPTPCTKLGGGEVPLSPTQKKNFRAQLVRFALVAEKYEHVWHYSQARPYTGLGTPFSFTHHNDCSSYMALLYFAAEHAAHVGVADPLGASYSGTGNTDSCYAFLKAHPAPKDKYRVGDIALYLEQGFEHHHVIMCRQAGTAATSKWTSFGQESGPQQEALLYRSDLTGVYRHPALL